MKNMPLVVWLSLSLAACSDDGDNGSDSGNGDTGNDGGSASADEDTSAADGDDDTQGATTDPATSAGDSGGGSCDADALLATSMAYCEAAAPLWEAVSCPFQPCDEQNFDGLINAAMGCGCELVAYYECETARFAAEDPTACSCDETQVLCPDEALCATEKTAFEGCLGGG